jgi:hypothetical protein
LLKRSSSRCAPVARTRPKPRNRGQLQLEFTGENQMLNKCSTFLASVFCVLSLAPIPAAAQDRNTLQLSNVKTVWVILMENHNWTDNNSGAARC